MKTMQSRVVQFQFQFQVFLVLVLLFLSFKPSLSDPRTTEAGLFCGPSSTKNFIPTFVTEMQSLSDGMSRSHFATHSINTSTPMYGLAQCHADLSHTDCLLCYAASRTRLPRCLPSLSARIFLDGCFLRYDNYSFFSEAVDERVDAVRCGARQGAVAAEEVVAKAVERALGNGFGVAEREGVYGLVQCWRSLGERDCGLCLERGKRNLLDTCVGRTQGRSLNAGCYLRFSDVQFFHHAGEPAQNGMTYEM